MQVPQVDALAMNRIHLAIIYYVYKRGELIVGSQRRALLFRGGMRGMQDCVECSFGV
jgi:hypothetical protein